MELRPGYKKTEIGVIPEEWDAIPVGDSSGSRTALTPTKRSLGTGTPIVNVYGRYLANPV